jgi:glyoxylase-like metal-dependent hydrolase (beta-lactamase superfamily II)
MVCLAFVVVCIIGLGAFAPPRVSAATTRLYVLDCGTIDVPDMSFFAGVRGERQVLPDPCFLVVHPTGILLWDTGLPDELAQVPEGRNYMGFTFRVTRTLAAQLAEIGVRPEAVTYLGISHLHADHVGNVALFPRATLLLQREEYQAAFGPTPARFGMDTAAFPTLRANPAHLLTGDTDLFGDGTVIIKRAPGHTPGHQSLFVRLRKTGNVLLSGDAAHLVENWTHRRVPGFNFDSTQSVRTMDDLAAFAKSEHAAVWIQHDPQQNTGRRHAPAFYE